MDIQLKALFELAKLNDQQRAAADATLAHRVVVIQGPPGTGKTTVSSTILKAQEMISRHMHKDVGSKVAVQAVTNSALDVIGVKLVDSGSRVIRAGGSVTPDSVGKYAAIISRQDNPGDRKCVQDALVEAKNWVAWGQKARLEAATRNLLAGKDVACGGAKLNDAGPWDLEMNTMRNAGGDRKSGFDPDLLAIVKDASGYQRIVLLRSIMALTLNVAANYLPPGFDFSLLDEASQAKEIEGVSGCILRVHPEKGKVALVGDSKQLGPHVNHDHLRETPLGRSMMERICENGGGGLKVVALVCQYRMPESICSIVNKCFYDGRLVTVHAHSEKSTPGGVVWAQGVSYRMINVDSQESGSTSYENYGERDAVIQYAKSMIDTGYPEGSVAILAPYSVQEEFINVALRKRDLRHACVSSVDESQGREFDVVLLSLVRSNRQGKAGFCLQDKRLNVALSRARLRLIVFGNFKCLMRGDSD